MASVWVHGLPQGGKRRPPEKVIKRVDEMEALLFNAAGQLVGGAYIEPCSPPSAAEPGQPKRAAAA